jgi:hypothetical protein
MGGRHSIIERTSGNPSAGRSAVGTAVAEAAAGAAVAVAKRICGRFITGRVRMDRIV